jgi:hypothetical protein
MLLCYVFEHSGVGADHARSVKQKTERVRQKVIDDKTQIRSHPNPDKRTICTMLYVTHTIQYISYANGGSCLSLPRERGSPTIA